MQHRFKQWHLPLLIIVSFYYALRADATSPFKNLGDRSGGGVMMNTANPATLLNPFLGSHGHSIRPHQQSTYGFNDNYSPQQYQSVPTIATNFLPIPNYHQLYYNQNQKFFSPQYPSAVTSASVATVAAAVHQAHKRQFRNPFDVIYEWRQLDYDYTTFLDRQRAILNGDFIPINNVPLGIARWRNRLFVTIPRWKNGVPASLASLPLPGSKSIRFY